MNNPDTALFTVSEAAEMCRGTLKAGSGDSRIYSVAADSRKAGKGSLFVALKGDRADGADYVSGAAENGAVCVVVPADRADDAASVLPSGVSVIAVEDPLKGLQSLAAEYAGRFGNLVRIGVTGSSGKTTTKEILASIFRREAPAVSNEGNLNSEIGLPLSLFKINASHRFGIFEMGINFPGEMDILADVFRPEYAVITNIGTAHSGPLGGVNGIADEKVKIFSFFTEKSTAFLPEKDPLLERMIEACGGRYRLFGEDAQDGVIRAEDAGINGWKIDYRGMSTVFSLPGRHNLDNLYAAVAVAEFFGVSREHVAEGIGAVKALPGRSRIIPGAVTVIEDSYNANADSVERAVEYLDGLSWEGRKIAVLGSMKELGGEAEALHARVGRAAAESDIRGLFFFGEEMKAAFDAARKAAAGKDCFFYTDFNDLETGLNGYVRDGDIVLLKGSRSMELERLVDKLILEEAGKIV